jgi:hypothetical protein
MQAILNQWLRKKFCVEKILYFEKDIEFDGIYLRSNLCLTCIV